MKNNWKKKLMVLLSTATLFQAASCADQQTINSLTSYVVETGVNVLLSGMLGG